MLNEHCLRLPKGFRLCHPSSSARLLKLRDWSLAQRLLLEQLHTALVGARQRRQQLRRYMAAEALADKEWLRLSRLCGISLIEHGELQKWEETWVGRVDSAPVGAE